jgi:hypothetical protein
MKKILIAAALAVAATGAMAQAKPNSISLFGNVEKASGGDASGSLFFSYGRMLTESLEGEFSISQNFGSDETTGVGLGLKYYLSPIGKAGATAPYLGVRTFAFTGDLKYTSAEALTGLEYGITESASLFGELFAGTRKFSGSGSEFLSDGNTAGLRVGLRLRF